MLRSFSYARRAALENAAGWAVEVRAARKRRLARWGTARRVPPSSPLTTSRGEAGLFPPLRGSTLLRLLEVEKALYELRYELHNRPELGLLPLNAPLGISPESPRPMSVSS